MAKKIQYMKITPLMALAILTLFVMMIPIITLVNINNETTSVRAEGLK